MIPKALMTDSLKKLFVSIAQKNGIRVEFRQDCMQPRASADGLITLPVPSAENAENFWLHGFHELSHLLEGMEWSYDELLKRLDPQDQLAMSVANIIVDNLCERNFFGEYEGVDTALAEGRGRYMQQFAKIPPENAMSDAIQALLHTLVYQDAIERKDWMGFEMECVDYPEITDETQKKLHEAVKATGFKKKLKSILDSPNPAAETETLVRDILKIINYEPKMMPQSGASGDGEPQDGEGQPCSACHGSGESENGEPCEACGGTGKEPGNPANQDGEHSEDSWDSHHSDSGIRSTDKCQGGSGEEIPFKRGARDFSEAELREMLKKLKNITPEAPVSDNPPKREYPEDYRTYIPWVKHRIIDLQDDYVNFHTHVHKGIIHALGDSTVSKQIAKYLKAMVQDRYMYGQKRGRIHSRSLHRIATCKPDDTPSIFKKKIGSLLKNDSSVTILLDCSGSMSGHKYAIGAACCVALADTLASLKIPHEVLGFTETDTLESYIFKAYGSLSITKEKLLQIMANRQVSLHNNADGESVMWAAERLLKRPEKRKLFVVLSDGSPAGRFRGDGGMYLKKICKMIEDETPIDLVGIGITTTAVQRYYEKNVVVNNPDELDGVLFGILKEFLT